MKVIKPTYLVTLEVGDFIFNGFTVGKSNQMVFNVSSVNGGYSIIAANPKDIEKMCSDVLYNEGTCSKYKPDTNLGEDMRMECFKGNLEPRYELALMWDTPECVTLSWLTTEQVEWLKSQMEKYL